MEVVWKDLILSEWCLLVISYGKLTFSLAVPDAFCTGSVEPAFHVREMGGSFRTAPALQNRLPPLGSDHHSSALCLCQPSLGALPLCMSSAHCAPREGNPSSCVLLQWEGKVAGFLPPGEAVSSHNLSGMTFTPGPVCSTKKDLNSVPAILNIHVVTQTDF